MSANVFKGQVEEFIEWQKTLYELSRKTKDQMFIDELKSIGPKGLSELKTLNSLEPIKLKRYLELFHEKKQLEINQWLTITGGGKEMGEETINEDEMIGFIMRKTATDHTLYYDDVRAVLNAEMEFLKQKGIAKDE